MQRSNACVSYHTDSLTDYNLPREELFWRCALSVFGVHHKRRNNNYTLRLGLITAFHVTGLFDNGASALGVVATELKIWKLILKVCYLSSRFPILELRASTLILRIAISVLDSPDSFYCEFFSSK